MASLIKWKPLQYCWYTIAPETKKNAAVMALIAKFAAVTVWKEIGDLVKAPVLTFNFSEWYLFNKVQYYIKS